MKRAIKPNKKHAKSLSILRVLYYFFLTVIVQEASPNCS